MRYRFRFDDVCINADMELIDDMTEFLFNRFPDCEVIYGVSPLVNDMSDANGREQQRVFPKIFNAYSSHKVLYEVDKCGIPEMDKRATLAGHGLVHVDHRLMHWTAQELSILTSCSLVKAHIFIPPFNKWNSDTQTICDANDIELIKFEDGWLSMEHNKFDDDHYLWYLHAREFTFSQFLKWFEQ